MIKERNKEVEAIRKKYNLDVEIIDLKIDVAFKKALSMESNRWYLAFIISYCTKLEIDYILKNLRFKNDFIAGRNVKNKTGSGDLIVEIENKIINLEMNREVTESLIRKNKWYVDTLNSTNTQKSSNKIINNKFIVQINISTTPRIPNAKTLMYEIVRMDHNLLVEDVYNNEIIYDINLEFLQEELYNKNNLNKEEKRLLIFIEKNKEKLKQIYRGDSNMKDTMENLEEVGYLDDMNFALEYDREVLDEQIRKEALENAEKSGIEQGIEQGEKNKAISVAKKLMEINMSKEQISSITNLSKEEIEKI